ncbi:MAG: hypothetical protein U0838_00600 [Chloroflexota bacterium]
MAFLCPWAAGESARDIAERPAAGLVDRSRRLAQRGSDEIASSRGRCPASAGQESSPNWVDPAPWPNPDAVAALRRARALADAAVFGGDEPWDMVVRLDTGLTRMGWATWNEIDRILRADVHRRLLWIGDVDPIEAEAFPDGEARLFARDGGVTSVDLPESLEALVLLDLVEALPCLDRRPGLCSFCGRPLLLSQADAERASDGGLVLHGTCEWDRGRRDPGRHRMSGRTRSPLRRLAAVLEADLGSPAALAAILARHAVTPARAFLGLPACAQRGPQRPDRPLLRHGRPAAVAGQAPPARDRAVPARLRPPVVARPGGGREPARRRPRVPLRAGRCAGQARAGGGAAAVAARRAARPGNPRRARGDPRAVARDHHLRRRVEPHRPRRAHQPATSSRWPWSEPEDPTELYARQSIGLTMLNRDTAFSIDEILRRDVHGRLVWLGDVEIAFDAEAVPGPGGTAPLVPLVVDRGVIDVLVPETLAGLVVLDFVESLRERHGYAACAVCRRLVVLDPRRAGRHRRGEPVYHPDCHAEFRLRVVRDAQRRRRAGAAVNSRSAGDALTDGS